MKNHKNSTAPHVKKKSHWRQLAKYDITIQEVKRDRINLQPMRQEL